jgi:hypothetical protein
MEGRKAVAAARAPSFHRPLRLPLLLHGRPPMDILKLAPFCSEMEEMKEDGRTGMEGGWRPCPPVSARVRGPCPADPCRLPQPGLPAAPAAARGRRLEMTNARIPARHDSLSNPSQAVQDVILTWTVSTRAPGHAPTGPLKLQLPAMLLAMGPACGV